MLDCFSRMTLEVILSTAFGVETDIQNDKESLLFKKVKEVFRTPWIMDILRRTVSFWNISFKDSGTNHAQFKVL